MAEQGSQTIFHRHHEEEDDRNCRFCVFVLMCVCARVCFPHQNSVWQPFFVFEPAAAVDLKTFHVNCNGLPGKLPCCKCYRKRGRVSWETQSYHAGQVIKVSNSQKKGKALTTSSKRKFTGVTLDPEKSRLIIKLKSFRHCCGCMSVCVFCFSEKRWMTWVEDRFRSMPPATLKQVGGSRRVGLWLFHL